MDETFFLKESSSVVEGNVLDSDIVFSDLELLLNSCVHFLINTL